MLHSTGMFQNLFKNNFTFTSLVSFTWSITIDVALHIAKYLCDGEFRTLGLALQEVLNSRILRVWACSPSGALEYWSTFLFQWFLTDHPSRSATNFRSNVLCFLVIDQFNRSVLCQENNSAIFNWVSNSWALVWENRVFLLLPEACML